MRDVFLPLACLAPFCSRRTFVLYVSAAGLLTVYFIVGGPGISLLGGLPVVKYIALDRTTFLLPLIIAMLAAQTRSEPKVPVWAAVAVSIALIAIACVAVRLNWGQAQEHWKQVQGPIVKAVLLLAVAVVLLLLRERFPGIRHVTEWGLDIVGIR